MGVEFYACNYCEETFCDCGEYVMCSCGNRWCSNECALEEGYVDEDSDNYGESSCSYCRNENYEDGELLNKALELLNMTREELILKMKGDN